MVGGMSQQNAGTVAIQAHAVQYGGKLPVAKGFRYGTR